MGPDHLAWSAARILPPIHHQLKVHIFDFRPLKLAFILVATIRFSNNKSVPHENVIGRLQAKTKLNLILFGVNEYRVTEIQIQI